MPLVILVLLVVGLDFALVQGRRTNYTIDDSFGDNNTGMRVQYSPPPGHPITNVTVWRNKQSCTNCYINPPCLHDGCTWSSATPPKGTQATASFQFNGSAIYIYFILANSVVSGVSSNTISDFILDGEHVGHYEHSANSSGIFQYNTLVYSNSSMPSRHHQFSIHLPYPSYAVFDYAVYTTEFHDILHPPSPNLNSDPDPGPSSSSSNLSSADSTAPSDGNQNRKLIAIIMGGVVSPLILMITGIVFLWRKYGFQFSASQHNGPNWIKISVSKLFRPEGSEGDRESIRSREFKLTPLPRRSRRHDSETQNRLGMRPFTPGLDMRCRGDNLVDEGTPRSQFEFLFEMGGEKTSHRKGDAGSENAQSNSEIMTKESPYPEAVSGQPNTGRYTRTLSQSSLNKIYDLHTRPLPPIPASPQMSSQGYSAVRLLPIPIVAVVKQQDSIPGTPPPGYSFD